MEKFLRSTGSQVSSEAASRVAAMRAKLDTLQARKSDRERAVYADNRDWGEVTDMRLIQRRLEDINELKVRRARTMRKIQISPFFHLIFSIFYAFDSPSLSAHSLSPCHQ